jgi:N-acetylmuramate 1-kinase
MNPQDRATLSADFLRKAGWGAATRHALAGDASARRYERLTLGRKRAVLMDSPPGQGDDPVDFVRMGAHLNGIGLSAPTVFARSFHDGFLLLEDLGDDLFAHLVRDTPSLEPALYTAATAVLTHLQRHPAPHGLANLSAADWADAACFAIDWYRFAITDDSIDTRPFKDSLTDLLIRHADGPRVLILRDYHAENLLWLPRRKGLRRVGLLDFQLGQMGQPAYDLVSLLQDARRDVTTAIETTMIARFAEGTGVALAQLEPAYAALGAQRALRILGVFARLCLVAGKPGYLTLIPRVWGQLQRNLAHPALSDLAVICAETLPQPTSENLQRITAKCGTHPNP